MTIGIIVEFELVDITDHDAKGLAKILFKIFPQCFAVQKARELVSPAPLIEFFIARPEMHAGLSKRQDQITPEKNDDQTDQIKEDDVILVLPGHFMPRHVDDGERRRQIDGDDGNQDLDIIINRQQIDQNEHEQVFKEETAPILSRKKSETRQR